MARVWVGRWLTAGVLPWGTVAVNVVGSLIIGIVLARWGPPERADAIGPAFVAVGFCGGFTTFSTFSWQTLEQIRSGQLGLAAVHVTVSVLLCLLAVWCGWRLGRL